MIKKLEIQEIEQSTGSEYTIIERVPATSEQMHDKINELIDTVNDIIGWIKRTDETIVKYGIKPIENGKCAKNAQGFKNLQDHRPNMVMDDPFGPHPNIYEQSMRMDKEFAEDECVRLQNELDRTRGALNIAIKTLKLIEHQGNCTDVEDEAFDCLEMIKSLGVEL